VVNVTHHSHNGRTHAQVSLVIFFLLNGRSHLSTDELNFKSKLLGQQADGFGIQTLVNRHKQTQRHTGGNDLVHLNVHHAGQFVGRHKFGNLNGLLLEHLLLHVGLHPLAKGIALIATVLGTL